MTGLITTLVGALVAAGALSTTAAAWPGPTDRAAPPAPPPAPTRATAPGDGAHVGVTVPVVAFSSPERLPDGRVRVIALLTDPGATATVEVAAPDGPRGCRASLAQGVPVVLDCAVGRHRSVRLAYTLSDGRSSATELAAP